MFWGGLSGSIIGMAGPREHTYPGMQAQWGENGFDVGKGKSSPVS